LLAKIIEAVAVAFLLVVASSRRLVVTGPRYARLHQPGHRAAAAAEPACPAFFLFARALHPLHRSAAEAVGHMRPELFLFHRALHRFCHLEEALPVDEIQTAGLRHVAHVHLRPSEPACRTADAQVIGRDSAPESPLLHVGQHSGPPLLVALAADYARQKTSRLRTSRLACLARLRFAQLPRLVRVSARPVCRVLCCVQTAQAKHLHAVPTAEVLCRDELVRLMAIGLTRALLWLLVPCDRLCRVGQVYSLDRARRPPGLFPDPVAGCPLLARQHELAAEHSLDFQL